MKLKIVVGEIKLVPVVLKPKPYVELEHVTFSLKFGAPLQRRATVAL